MTMPLPKFCFIDAYKLRFTKEIISYSEQNQKYYIRFLYRIYNIASWQSPKKTYYNIVFSMS